MRAACVHAMHADDSWRTLRVWDLPGSGMHAEAQGSAPVAGVHVADGDHAAQAGKRGRFCVPRAVGPGHPDRPVHLREAQGAISDAPALEQLRLLPGCAGAAGRHPGQRWGALHAERPWLLIILQARDSWLTSSRDGIAWPVWHTRGAQAMRGLQKQRGSRYQGTQGPCTGHRSVTYAI